MYCMYCAVIWLSHYRQKGDRGNSRVETARDIHWQGVTIFCSAAKMPASGDTSPPFVLLLLLPFHHEKDRYHPPCNNQSIRFWCTYIRPPEAVTARFVKCFGRKLIFWADVFPYHKTFWSTKDKRQRYGEKKEMDSTADENHGVDSWWVVIWRHFHSTLSKTWRRIETTDK
jgi:hypothetical protein